MKVGIQLFSVKEALKADPKATLRKVAELGYRYIEPFCFPDGDDERSYGLYMNLEEAKAFLQEVGLQVVSAHYYPLGSAAFDHFCQYYAALGVKHLGCGGAHFPGGMADVERYCELMNHDCAIAAKHGLKYFYHNHYREYQLVEGRQIIDIILEKTKDAGVYYELDNFWAARGGIDPVKEMERLGNRIILLHQKDFSKTAGIPLNIFEQELAIDHPVSKEEDQLTRHLTMFAEVGTGILPIQDYIDAGNRIGVEYMLLEQDKTQIGEIPSITESMKAFHKFTGIEWDK